MFNTRLGRALALSVLLFSVAAPATAVEMTSVGVIRDGETDETVGYAVTADGILLRHATSWGFECLGDWQSADIVEIAAYFDTIRRVSGVYAVSADGILYNYYETGGFTEVGDLAATGVSSLTAFYNPGVLDITTYHNPNTHLTVVYAVTEDGNLYKYDTVDGFEWRESFAVTRLAGAATHFDAAHTRATVFAVTERGDLFRYATSAGMEGLIGNFGASGTLVDLAAYYAPAALLSVVYAVTTDGQLSRWDSAEGFTAAENFGVENVVSLAACFHSTSGENAVYAVTQDGELLRYSSPPGTVVSIGNFGAPEEIVEISAVSRPAPPLEVVHAVTANGELWSYDPVNGFGFVADYGQAGLRTLASYHNPDQPVTAVYACTESGGLYRYDTESGLDGLVGHFGSGLDAVIVHAATERGDLHRFSSTTGASAFLGNFSATGDIADITSYYNPRIALSVVYAITPTGKMYKYDTSDGFELRGDFGVGGVVSTACYFKQASYTTPGVTQAVVYAATESGGLYRYNTSGGMEGLVGTFPTASSLRDIALYREPGASFALVYAITDTGELHSYSLADGFEPLGVFPEPDCGTGTGIASNSYPMELAQNYPNPFNPSTTISFTTGTAGPATVGVYDVQGRLVRVLWNVDTAPGTRVVTWDGTDERGEPVASGVYLCRLAAGDQQVARKMMLLK